MERVQNVNYFDSRHEYDAVGSRLLAESMYRDGVARLRNKSVYFMCIHETNGYSQGGYLQTIRQGSTLTWCMSKAPCVHVRPTVPRDEL